jgi:hypothetical protein
LPGQKGFYFLTQLIVGKAGLVEEFSAVLRRQGVRLLKKLIYFLPSLRIH